MPEIDYKLCSEEQSPQELIDCARRAEEVGFDRQGGARSLNLSRKSGEALRLALVDPAGVRSEGAPHIEVALVWAWSSSGVVDLVISNEPVCHAPALSQLSGGFTLRSGVNVNP